MEVNLYAEDLKEEFRVLNKHGRMIPTVGLQELDFYMFDPGAQQVLRVAGCGVFHDQFGIAQKVISHPQDDAWASNPFARVQRAMWDNALDPSEIICMIDSNVVDLSPQWDESLTDEAQQAARYDRLQEKLDAFYREYGELPRMNNWTALQVALDALGIQNSPV